MILITTLICVSLYAFVGLLTIKIVNKKNEDFKIEQCDSIDMLIFILWPLSLLFILIFSIYDKIINKKKNN